MLVCRDQLLHLAAIAMCELMLGELQAAGVPVATADREKCSEGKEVLALVGEPRQTVLCLGEHSSTAGSKQI